PPGISRPKCVLAQGPDCRQGPARSPAPARSGAAPLPRRTAATSPRCAFAVSRQVREVVLPVTRARIDMAPERRLIVARGTQPGATAAAGRIVREWPRPQVARPLKRDEVELIRMDAVNMATAKNQMAIYIKDMRRAAAVRAVGGA